MCPLFRGQPPYKRQYTWSQYVLYSEDSLPTRDSIPDPNVSFIQRTASLQETVYLIPMCPLFRGQPPYKRQYTWSHVSFIQRTASLQETVYLIPMCPLFRGQPPYKRQYTWSQCVLYSEDSLPTRDSIPDPNVSFIQRTASLQETVYLIPICPLFRGQPPYKRQYTWSQYVLF